ncbi:hypothetical protein FQA39_LY07664 [Lamprigera yunnana]|nr:hypothetical protein FQA39_LY07664 [Lamprigera yunnana]
MVVDGGEDTCGSSNSSEKMNSDTEDSESEEVPVLPQSDSEEDINFEINDFVVTKFTTEEDNRCRLYLGKIMEIGISECNISFLRKKIGAKETYFYFPEVPDIAKEKVVYEKEAEQQRVRIEKFKQEGKDEYDIRKQEEVLQESLMMIPDCQRMLAKAIQELKTIVDNELDLKELEDYQTAIKIIEEAKVQLPPPHC